MVAERLRFSYAICLNRLTYNCFWDDKRKTVSVQDDVCFVPMS